jgi:hypothetical protein
MALPFPAMQGFVLPLPSGDAGIYATLEHMRILARNAALQPLVRNTAARAVAGVSGFDGNMQARILQGFIEDHTQFLSDPAHAEMLIEPASVVHQILTQGIAQLDCDDVATLAAAMGLAIGLRARFVIVGFGSSPNAPFRHVWTELADARRPRWLAVDPTRPAQGLDGLAISRRRFLEV